jgi:quercetin dioxygenase-like cupin family protein
VTYPSARYLGHTGQLSASFRPADHDPELIYANGNTVHYLATGAATDGDFGMYRWEMGPEPSGPAPHFHRSLSESFYVLAGTVRIFDGARWIDTVPGDFVHVPPGGIHAFRNESGEAASMLLHFSPGAPREGYFEGLTQLEDATEDERSAFFLRHDNIWI